MKKWGDLDGYGFGTYSIVLVDRCHPQDIVVFLTTLSPKFDPPPGKAKNLLDKLFHPAKIQPVFLSLKLIGKLRCLELRGISLDLLMFF